MQIGLPGEFPTAFAALAVDTAEGLVKIRTAHENAPGTGTGWHLVCWPARPAPPFELEQRITGTALVTDRDLVGKKLAELREIEGELDADVARGDIYADVARGDIYAEAITLLEWQLRYAAKQAGEIYDTSHDYVPVADDVLLRYSGPWGGPVTDAWRETLTRWRTWPRRCGCDACCTTTPTGTSSSSTATPTTATSYSSDRTSSCGASRSGRSPCPASSTRTTRPSSRATTRATPPASDTYIRLATFSGVARFESATFSGDADFRSATFDQGVPQEVQGFSR